MKKKITIGAILALLMGIAIYLFCSKNLSGGNDGDSDNSDDDYGNYDNSHSDDYDEDESESESIKTISVNGVTFNMVLVGNEEDNHYILGSNLTGVGLRTSEFEYDHEKKDDAEDESDDDVYYEKYDSDFTNEELGFNNGYDEWADYDEGPLHYVSLSNPDFYIGETEVTVELWDAVMDDSVSLYVSPKHPITNVSWYDCCNFIERLNDLTGYNFRLPTEAEWEIAAVGLTSNPGDRYRYSGSDSCKDVAWYNENTQSVHDVALLQANQLGIYDMSGNVWEWCLDYYDDAYYDKCKYRDPLCTNNTGEKVLRGGSFTEPYNRVRPQQRIGRYPDYSDYYDKDFGFRLYLSKNSKDVYKNKAVTDKDIYEYVPLSRYFKGESMNTKPLNVTKQVIPDGLKYTINDDVSFVLKKVQGGTFTMGDPKDNRKVSITYDYYIGETEVTDDLYYTLEKENKYRKTFLQKPLCDISYNAVLALLDSLKSLTGDDFRLPTEAEWEYAAQGGNKSKSFVYAGTNNLNDVVCDMIRNVKQRCANELGLYDMSGNVWEFCYDQYQEDFYKYLPNVNPVGCPLNTDMVMAKGGGADDNATQNDFKCYSTKFCDRTHGKSNIGFRLCLSSFTPNSDAYFEIKNPTKTSENNYEIYRLNDYISFKMVPVKAGKFTKDATNENTKNKKSVNSFKASVDNDFSIGETEVTQELYYAVMGSNPSTYANPKGPVSNVSWNDIMTFINKLNTIFKTDFRLPTEYEWEFSAKGGNLSKNYVFSGSNTLNDVAWYLSNKKPMKCYSVATKKPNELGLYDMSGNVWECCSDKNSNNNIVLLGGGLYSDMATCSFINRYEISTSYKNMGMGFRLVR